MGKKSEYNGSITSRIIPKIIHQIWDDRNKPLPSFLSLLAETWKEQYPAWQYEFWDGKRIEYFIVNYYPELANMYHSFKYDAQRWDAVRYLILNVFGGMYVDFDYESLLPIDDLIEGKTCCFSQEPSTHQKSVMKKKHDEFFSNSLILSIPSHPFLGKIIRQVFSEKTFANNKSKFECVLDTTGPWMLTNLYESLNEMEQKDIYLIPAKYVTPFDAPQMRRVKKGDESDDLEECLREAYAVHYFFGLWI